MSWYNCPKCGALVQADWIPIAIPFDGNTGCVYLIRHGACPVAAVWDDRLAPQAAPSGQTAPEPPPGVGGPS